MNRTDGSEGLSAAPEQEKQLRAQPGAPPGTLLSHHLGPTLIDVVAYGKGTFETFPNANVADLKRLALKYDVIWVNLVGLGDLELIKQIGDEFGLHKLTLEDILNTEQRAKFESFDHYDYVVTRMGRFVQGPQRRIIETEQLSIVRIGKFVFTFQQVAADCLDPVRSRLIQGSGIILKRGPDYLVYALVDTVIDHYFPIIDELTDLISKFEDAILDQDIDVSTTDIHHVRRELLSLYRTVRPHREMLTRMVRDTGRFTDETRVFVSDCLDNAIQLTETIESGRENCSELRSYHLAMMGNRTNEVMKTLTIVSTIFIPLSFIAGLYGMNFDYMPELKWKFGYFVAIGSMTMVAGGLLLWFKHRGWFRD